MKNIGNVFILGDSYSTFQGYIPGGYFTWYFRPTQTDTDVLEVTQTWWHQLLEKTKSNLVLNCSFSGSTICYTEREEDGYKGTSFCHRLSKLISDGFFKENEIDTFFIFGGTNDSWLGVPLGEIMYGEKTEQDLYSLFPAFCYLIEKIKENCKNARIITVVNTDLKPEISNMMNEVSNHYNTEVINLSGITKQSGHPNVKGMGQIYSQIFEKL